MSAMEPMTRERVFELESRIRTEMTKWLKGLDEPAKILTRALFMSLPYSDKITRTKRLGQPQVMFTGDTGIGKTDLAMSLAMSVRAKFKRIQGMPHLMSRDFLGEYVIAENLGSGERSIRFRPGKLFAHIVLIDETNRILAEAKAAVMEGMEERSVTLEHEHIDLGERGSAIKSVLPLFPVSGDPLDDTGDRFYIIISTQNIFGEEEGTQPNPRAELDRITLFIPIERPALEDEMKISVFNVVGKRIEEVTDLEEVSAAGKFIHKTVQPDIEGMEHEYRARLLQSTDPKKVAKVSNNKRLIKFVEQNIFSGASPRVNLHLEPAAQVFAFFDDSNIIKPEHIKMASRYVIPHRFVFREERERAIEKEFGRQETKNRVFDEILSMVEMPKWK